MNYLIKISRRILNYKNRWLFQEKNAEVIRTNFNMNLYLDYLKEVNTQNSK